MHYAGCLSLIHIYNNLHLIICNTDLIESIEDEEELINEQLQNNVDAFVICPAPGKETKTMLNRLQGERPFILINEDTYAEEPSGYALSLIHI